MIDTRLKLTGVVRPYFGRPRLRSQRAAAKSEANHAAASPPTPKSAPTAAPDSVPRPKTSTRPQPVLSRATQEQPPDVRGLVRQVANAAGWAVVEFGADLQLHVPTEGNRSQVVSVADRRDRDGRPLLVVASLCGSFEARNAGPLLRYNAKLSYGAFVVERTADREEMVVLRATLPAASAGPEVLRRLITEIAQRADKVEGRLNTKDQF